MKSVFVASSRKYYNQVFAIRDKLEELGVKGFYPYIDETDIEDNPEEKKKATVSHFPEIDEIDSLYALTPEGRVGYSVTIEIAYAYAKGKEVITSEPVQELAVKALVSKEMSPEEFIEYVSRKS